MRVKQGLTYRYENIDAKTSLRVYRIYKAITSNC